MTTKPPSILGAIALASLLFPPRLAAQPDAAIAGCWAGAIGAEATQRRAALELVRSDGAWRGALHVLSRRIDTDSLADIAPRAGELSFRTAVPDSAATFRGRAAGDTIAGELTRAGRTLPIRLGRAGPDPASALIGYWFGWLEQGGARVLRLGLEFTAAPCGQVLLTMDSPDQGQDNLPVSTLSVTGDSVRFDMLYLGGAFRGTLRPARDSLIGLWSQGGAMLELKLGRTDSMPSVARPQEPRPPLPYDAEDVAYHNPRDSTRFAGTLTLPRGAGPFPAALLLTGSGPQNRDGAIVGHRPFLVIADHLTRRGLAVLRVDDRGMGGSTGDVYRATLEDNAGDALAGVRFLQGHPRIDRRRIGLIGHSEGGWVAPLAAARSADVAFVVLLAGPAVSGEDIRHAQDSVMALLSGASLEYVAADRAISSAVYAALKAEPDDSAALRRLAAAAESAHAALQPAWRAAWDARVGEAQRAQFAQGFRLLATPWFRHLLAYDPVPTLRRLRTPVLALFGEKDVQVPPGQSVAPMEAALRAAGNRDFTVRVLPGLNHLFQHAETGLIDEYGRIEETFAPQALELIGSWILDRVGR